MKNSRSLCVSPISNMGDVIIERIVINFKGEILNGYLHLLEHLWVRSNKLWLDNFERDMNIFNAMTEKNKITFVFIYTGCAVNTNDLNFNMEFSESDFFLEKNTIQEERKLYTNDVQDVDVILGSLDDINNFDLSVLIKMMKNIKYDIIRFKFSSKFNDKQMISHVLRGIDKNSINWVSSERIQISTLHEYNLLSAILKIFNLTNENFTYTSNKLYGSYEIIVKSREELNYMILYKDNVLKRYQLLRSNIQLDIEQIVYLFDLFGFIPGISELWNAFDWEVLKQ